MSPNKELLAALQRAFPQLFSKHEENGVIREKLDLEKIRLLAGNGNYSDKYGLRWEDKPEQFDADTIGKLPTLTRVADKAINSNPAKPTHALIQGDNYHALKVLRSSPVLFVLRAGYADEMRKIVEHQVTVGIKNIAVVYQNDGFGKAGLKSFEEAMAKYDLKPAATAAIDPVNLDAKPAVAILNKAAPAAVILATAGQGSSAIVREYLKTGSRPQFFGLSVVSAGQLRNELGKDVSGLVIAQVVPSPWSSKYPVVRQYRDALASRGEEPNYAALEGYVAAKVLVEGLRRSGKALTRGKLVSSLEEMKNWDAGGWSVDFGPGKHNASSFVDLSILRGDGTFLQ